MPPPACKARGNAAWHICDIWPMELDIGCLPRLENERIVYHGYIIMEKHLETWIIIAKKNNNMDYFYWLIVVDNEESIIMDYLFANSSG